MNGLVLNRLLTKSFLNRMTNLFSTFLACLVLVHSVFGCCVHHAHAEEGAGDRDGFASPECLGHDHASFAAVSFACPQCEPNEPHHGSHRCEGSRCNFARTEISRPDSADGVAGDWLPACAALVAHGSLEYLRKLEQNDLRVAAPPLAQTGVRAHLLLSVLLV